MIIEVFVHVSKQRNKWLVEVQGDTSPLAAKAVEEAEAGKIGYTAFTLKGPKAPVDSYRREPDVLIHTYWLKVGVPSKKVLEEVKPEVLDQVQAYFSQLR